jgi:hypothetical protein
MSTPTIQLQLSIDDMNLILEALGEQPFKLVYGLVGRLQNQAREQLQGQASGSSEAPSPEEGP